MTPAVYLLVAVGIVVVVLVALWALNRQPRSIESGIEEFRREMNALAPEREDPSPTAERPRRAGRRGPRRGPGQAGE